MFTLIILILVILLVFSGGIGTYQGHAYSQPIWMVVVVLVIVLLVLMLTGHPIAWR